MDINKKKIKFLEKLEKAKNGETVTAVEFKRKHFKCQLSTPYGFGLQDLKSKSYEFFTWLITNGYKPNVVPTTNGVENFGVLVTVTKN